MTNEQDRQATELCRSQFLIGTLINGKPAKILGGIRGFLAQNATPTPHLEKP